MSHRTRRSAFSGRRGTSAEEASAAARVRPAERVRCLLSCTSCQRWRKARVDYGFVAIENSIEGTVSIALDQLVFERDLIIVGEVVLPVTQNLVAPSGTRVGEIKRVVSFPHALGQCRSWMATNLPEVEEVAATSTAEAVRLLAAGEDDGHTAAIGTALAAELYGLEVVAAGIEDHEDNATRFVLVAPHGAGGRGLRGTTRRAWCAFRHRTIPAACTGSSGSSRPGT